MVYLRENATGKDKETPGESEGDLLLLWHPCMSLHARPPSYHALLCGYITGMFVADPLRDLHPFPTVSRIG